VRSGLKREELIAANSMILHECYFAGLGEPNAPAPALAEAINHDFGSMDQWRRQFAATPEDGEPDWLPRSGEPPIAGLARRKWVRSGTGVANLKYSPCRITSCALHENHTRVNPFRDFV
jgi:hypothetical protein